MGPFVEALTPTRCDMSEYVQGGVVSMRAFVEALAWKRVEWPSLKDMLHHLHLARLQRPLINAVALGMCVCPRSVLVCYYCRRWKGLCRFSFGRTRMCSEVCVAVQIFFVV